LGSSAQSFFLLKAAALISKPDWSAAESLPTVR